MSATEKLKALEEALVAITYTWANGEQRVQLASKEAHALRRALPQIVAVIEAAEAQSHYMSAVTWDGRDEKKAVDLSAALAALDEQLGESSATGSETPSPRYCGGGGAAGATVVSGVAAEAELERVRAERDAWWERAKAELNSYTENLVATQARLDRAVGALRTAQTLVQAKSAREVWIYLEGELLALAEIEESA